MVGETGRLDRIQFRDILWAFYIFLRDFPTFYLYGHKLIKLTKFVIEFKSRHSTFNMNDDSLMVL